MAQANGGRHGRQDGQTRQSHFWPRRAARAALTTEDGLAVCQEETRLPLDETEAEIWQSCDGSHSIQDLVREVAPEPAVSAALRRFCRHHLLQTIEEAALEELLAFHGPRLQGLRIADICTADYFTAVELSDGSQGAAINFNNVSGPHRTPFRAEHHDYLLTRLIRDDPLLLDSFLRWPVLDCLGQSVRVAVLNALSHEARAQTRLGEHGLQVCDGYLDLASFLRQGDVVTMIGCTGNYSCPAVGQVPFLEKIHFSDFEYTGPFKSGIEDCIRQFFLDPSRVVLSDGSDNEAICGAADVVILIADTLCTSTLDELLLWSAGAREVLITGRSYAMNPVHAFRRGASGLTTQRIVQPGFVRYVRDKVRRGEFGFTDALVGCFERMFVVPLSPPAPDRYEEALPASNAT